MPRGFMIEFRHKHLEDSHGFLSDCTEKAGKGNIRSRSHGRLQSKAN